MVELKLISKEAIPAALARAERYRLLNQPRMAESICHDVLRADPQNPKALVALLLSLTDQFGRHGYGVGIKEVKELLARLPGEYEKAYYEGLICERWGKALLSGRSSVTAALDWLRRAMSLFEKAEAKRPGGRRGTPPLERLRPPHHPARAIRHRRSRGRIRSRLPRRRPPVLKGSGGPPQPAPAP